MSESFSVAQCGGSGLRKRNSQAGSPQKASIRGPHVASDKPDTGCMRQGALEGSCFSRLSATCHNGLQTPSIKRPKSKKQIRLPAGLSYH